MRIALALAILVCLLAGTATAASLITSKQIKNGTIQTVDLSAKAKRALKGRTGPQGPTGPPGPPGPTGESGLASSVATTFERHDLGLQSVGGANTKEHVIACPNGGTALWGGASGLDVEIEESHPSTRYGDARDAPEWYLVLSHPQTFWQYHPWIVCARP